MSKTKQWHVRDQKTQTWKLVTSESRTCKLTHSKQHKTNQSQIILARENTQSVCVLTCLDALASLIVAARGGTCSYKRAKTMSIQCEKYGNLLILQPRARRRVGYYVYTKCVPFIYDCNTSVQQRSTFVEVIGNSKQCARTFQKASPWQETPKRTLTGHHKQKLNPRKL